MNRIAKRSLFLLILVIALGAGMVFFVGEYIAGAEDWIMFPGSPHVYSGGKLGTGIITDREGLLLTDLNSARIYSPNPEIRTAVLHWVGDRQGNISVPLQEQYSWEMLGYSLINGTYRYGETSGNMKLTISARAQAAALEAMGDYAGTVAV